MAANFRSTCGSERSAPECSTHRSPTEDPQVGQLTEEICLGLRSFLFMEIKCDNSQPLGCSILHTFAPGVVRDLLVTM
jgi:hypothetical protein